ncbi:MAG: C10 family peptidase [Bacteroidaceae bacterium]|nr:C10 family peptidase [Bacteroidaceae bacterium]
MKKQSILILFLVLCAISASAAPIGKSKAQAVAASFFQKSSMKAKVKGATVVLSKEYASSKDAPTAFYAFSRGENVVFVSADDEMPAILGYSERSDLDNLPPAMEYMLDYYARLTDAVRRGEIPAPKLYASPAAVEPLCKTIWDQSEPFCSLCPVYEGKKTPNGCVSTAIAQVMKYHEWPTKPTGTTAAYKTGQDVDTEHSSQKKPVIDVPSVELDTHTYNWADMINDYTGSYTEVQGKAVGQLCYDIAVASRMEFAPNSMGGSGTPVAFGAIALRDNFGYSKDIYVDYPEYYTEEEWVEKVKNEINQKRPLPYGGTDAKTGAGHCFVLDGYNAEGLFHVNWGWGGDYNDYFLITSLNPDHKGIGGGSGDGGYTDKQTTIFNCIPDRDGKSVATSEHFRFDYECCSPIKMGAIDDISIVGLRNRGIDDFHGQIVIQLVDKDNKVVEEKVVLSDFTLKAQKKCLELVSLSAFDFSHFADGLYHIDVLLKSSATDIKYPAMNLLKKTRVLVRSGFLDAIFQYDKQVLIGEILSCEYASQDGMLVDLNVKVQLSNFDDEDFVSNASDKKLCIDGNLRYPAENPDERVPTGDGKYNFEDTKIKAGETVTLEKTLQLLCLYEDDLEKQELLLMLSLNDGAILFDSKVYPMKDLITAINDVKADKELNAPIFNTKGQRVNPNAVQGIFIRNGKKIVKK